LRLNDLLCVSVRQVIRHRRRYLGVVLAIALGVAGLMTVITMSREVKKNFNENLDLIGGVTIIRVYFDNQRSYRPQWFRERTLAALVNTPGIKDLSLSAVKYTEANHHGQRYGLTALAVDEDFWQVNSFWAQLGRLFGPGEVSGRQRVCVLGRELAKKIFGTQNVVGQSLEINHEIFRISGILGGVADSGLSAHRPPLCPLPHLGRCGGGGGYPPQGDRLQPVPRRAARGGALGRLEKGAAFGLVDRVPDIFIHQRHLHLGGSRNLERNDGRGHLPHPGNRLEEGHGGGG
jgi:hypothetical protein